MASSSGKITVTANGSTDTSSDDFFVVPSDQLPSDVGLTGRIAIGTPADLTIPEGGKSGLVLFDGTQGQALSLYVSSITPKNALVLDVYAPGGQVTLTGTVLSGLDSKFELPPLPSTGTYTVAIQPDYNGVQLSLTVLQDASANLSPGVASTMSLVSGQNGRYVFSGQSGDTLSVACTALSTVPVGVSVTLSVAAPDGHLLWSSIAAGPNSWQLPQLPATGNYTLMVQPVGPTAAAMTFLLSQPNFGIVAVDGDAVSFQNTVPGQSGRYMFVGQAGDPLGFGISALTLTPSGGSVSLNVYKPDGSQMWSSSANGPTSFQLPQLPSTGTYVLTIQPPGTASAAITFCLSHPITGTAATDGTAMTYQTARVGQAGRYNFAGIAGQRFTMDVTTGAGLVNTLDFTVYQPSGAMIGWANLAGNVHSKIDLGALPASGIYTVTLVPEKASIGQVTFRIVAGASDTLVIDDPPKTLTLGAAQNGRYTFSGAAGDLLGLGVSASSYTDSYGPQLTILRPDGSSLWSGSPSRNPTSWQLPSLPVAGTYTLTVNQSGVGSASLTLLLSHWITGTVVTDGTATTYQTTRVGQAGRYTFTGVAGQRFTMESTSGAGLVNALYLTVYQPNGASIGWAQLASNTDTKIDLGALPASGVYAVTLVPQGGSIGQVTFRLIAGASDTLVIDDPPKTLTLEAAQNGRYTFSGVAGDLLGLGVSASSYTDSYGPQLTILKPDGSSLWSGSPGRNPANWQLPQLPLTGTYTLAVQPSGVGTASLTILFSHWITGTVATDGTATTYQTARVGQAGRYTFTGVAGQRFTMQVTSGAGLVNGLAFTVYQPSGAMIGWAQLASNADTKIDLGALPASGVYAATLVPQGGSVGQVTFRVIAGATETLVIDDPPKTLTLGAAQNGRYTFTGAAGDLLNLTETALATTPAGQTVTVTLYKPDGTTALWSAYSSVAASWALPQLSVAGTYTLGLQISGTAAGSVSARLVRR